ncbi:uncharacterized protein LOC133196738 [Saccostrea echinata]|uniref:uncharacterized protein LOC133196738 n=1 Tax=Saccostrea echinata TaxID=191078 RepID=UPI002A82CD2F|nr:uncharacterized protein LOC133196738 [Saccostrea echinata]
MVEKNKTCSDCASSRMGCEFCVRPVQLNESILSIKALIWNLIPGQKYIIGDFSAKSIREIPPPTECLVHRGALDTEFVVCNNYFEDGCRRLETPEKQSELKITISVINIDPISCVGSTSKSFEGRCSEGTTLSGNGSTKLERIKMIWLLISATLISMISFII